MLVHALPDRRDRRGVAVPPASIDVPSWLFGVTITYSYHKEGFVTGNSVEALVGEKQQKTICKR